MSALEAALWIVVGCGLIGLPLWHQRRSGQRVTEEAGKQVAAVLSLSPDHNA